MSRSPTTPTGRRVTELFGRSARRAAPGPTTSGPGGRGHPDRGRRGRPRGRRRACRRRWRGVDQASTGPVVLVPGYGGTRRRPRPGGRGAASGRVATVVPFEPTEGGTGDLRVQARRLAEPRRAAPWRTPERESVDVVGYSAGGVIARLFVRDEGGASVVRRVLTLGSPHHGTDVAAIAADAAGGCPTACEQMAPGSALLRPPELRRRDARGSALDHACARTPTRP